MRLEDVGVIGNCQFSALVDRTGAIVWSCMPRFDDPPVFGALLDDTGGGRFTVAPADGSPGVQRYLPNTNVLETRFDGPDGAFRVLDFAPRFVAHDRVFRPVKIVRLVEPLRGTPIVRVVCDPRLGWSRAVPRADFGSNHVSFQGFRSELRLTTDVPISCLGGPPFALSRRRHFVLAWGAPVEEPLEPLCERFFSSTVRYWEHWVMHCNVPAEYQQEVIRSALALKLHCFEDTGAIVAAMTTSIPEAPGAGRTWDYRYCWLRDAYYAINAFRLLGHFEEREKFVELLLGIAGSSTDLELAPLYRVDGSRDLEESVVTGWPGFEGEGPVRVGNAAALHRQHDVFGEMVLALAPVFFDERFRRERSDATFDLLIRLARKAIAVAGKPDAGIWEYRSTWVPQTFSSLMCWAAADRGARIASLRNDAAEAELARAASAIREQVLARALDSGHGGLVGTYGGTDLDAALLQAAPLRFLPRDDERLIATIDAIARGLDHNGWLMRYRADDGLGKTTMAFVLCTFWWVQALAAVGRKDEARTVMARACGAVPALGLMSEHWDPIGRRLWGNFPQAYSHVGLIHAAFAASPSWSEVL